MHASLWIFLGGAVLVIALVVTLIVVRENETVEVDGHRMRRGTVCPHLGVRILSPQFRALQRTVLDEFEQFIGWANRHGLRYYLIGGNLLGLVRAGDLSKPVATGKMIPWDDDIDVILCADTTEKVWALYGPRPKGAEDRWIHGTVPLEEGVLEYNPYLGFFKLRTGDSNGLDMFPLLSTLLPYQTTSEWRQRQDRIDRRFADDGLRPVLYHGLRTWMPDCAEEKLHGYCHDKYGPTWSRLQHPSM